jgi:CheY-like chemotaxis protein
MSLKLMVVDDEPRSSALMRSVAAPLGYLVQPFEDYELAAKKGEAQAFDAIFVGMAASEPTGLELVRRLRRSEPNRGSVLVILSVTDDVVALRKAFGEGADLFLVKPIQGDRLHRMLAAFLEWKGKRHAARLPFFGEVLCNWNGRQFQLRSSNISESGMLLRPAPEVEVGQEVHLEFRIAEIHSSLSVVGRVVRKDGAQAVGVQFIGLRPEEVNAIHVYVTGRMKDFTRPASAFLSDTRPRRLFNP